MATQEKIYRDAKDINDAELCLMSDKELERFFGTDAESGLSAREANARLKKRISGRLFAVKGKSTLQCVRDSFAYPMLWLLLALALVAVLFSHILLGVAIAILTVGEGVLLGLISRKQQQLGMRAQDMDAPTARVLRGGKLYRIPEDSIVVGDVVLLFQGDIVPADVRLLYADVLEVEEYITSQKVILSKTASPLKDPPTMGNANSPANMIYAGDVICRGVGVAVVFALGDDTHVGAKDGEIRPLHFADSEKKRSAVAATVENFFSVYSLVSSIAVIPLIIISLLTLNGKADLLHIILTALALSVSSVGARAAVLVTFNHTVCVRGLARLGESGTSSIVKSEKVVDTLGKTTDIVAVGSAALHDGIPHPEQFIVNGNVYFPSEGDTAEELTDFVECFYLISKYGDFSRSDLSYSDIQLLARLNAVQPDTDAIAIRIDGTASVKNGVRVMYKNGQAQLLILTDSFNAFRRNIDDVSLADKYNTFRSTSLEAGMKVLYMFGGDGTLPLGAIAYARHTSRRTQGAVSTFEERGVRVFAFDGSESAEAVRAMRECGFSQIHRQSAETDGEGVPLEALANEGVRAFVGVSNLQIEDFIYQLKACGRTVTVVAHSLCDANLLNIADVAVACTPACAAQSRRPLSGEEAPDSMPNGNRACDLMLRRADLLIGRATETGGGFVSLLRAHSSSMRCDRKLTASLKYLLVSMAARVVLTCLTMIFGLSLVSCVTLLLSGMVFDAAAMLSIALAGDANVHTDASGSNTSLKRRSPAGLIASAKPELLSTLIAVAAYALVLLLASLIGLASISELSKSSGIALLLLQLACYVQLVRWRAKEGRGVRLAISRASVLFTLFLLVLVIAAAAAYASSGLDVLHLAFALILPIAYGVCRKMLFKKT